MEFSFDRSVVLDEVACSADGKSAVITRAFYSKPICIPKGNIRFSREQRLSDSSVRVVDLGPLGEQTQEVIIAAGRKDRFPVF